MYLCITNCIIHNVSFYYNSLREKILAWIRDRTRVSREEFLLGLVDRLGGLVGIAPSRVRILAQARIFSLKLLIYDLPDGYSES